jgi:hypothetical protein
VPTTNIGPCGCCGGTVATDCCPDDEVPQTLTATFTGDLTGSFTISYDAGNNWWHGSGMLSPDCTTSTAIRLRCVGGPAWSVQFLINLGACYHPGGGELGFTSESCDPFVLVRAFTTGTMSGCCETKNFTLTITP